MRRLMINFSALACTLWLVSGSVAAQESSTRFEGRVDVSEVLLDVVVLDRDGNLVVGLDTSDFVIEAGGRKVEPTSVDFYTTHYVDGGALTPANQIPGSRYFILFFHDQLRNAGEASQLLQQQVLAGRRSRDWLEEEMGPSDWVAVVGYDVKLKIHQDFTQDRGRLLTAVDEAVRGVDPERDGRYRSEASHLDASLLRRLPSGIDLRRKTTRIYDAMRLVAEASGHIVGRKNLLLYSIGFGDISRDGIARPDRRYYPDLEQALNANNVAVYPLDLTPRNADHLQSSFLNKIADDSGGAYYQFFTDYRTPLRRIASEATGYYLLSFEAEHPTGESGYRKVKVKTTDKQFTARAQKGYRYGD